MGLESEMNRLLYGTLEEIDPFMAELIDLEEEQQVEKLILVASVSFAPRSTLRALGSVLQNVCAEGYPSWRMRREPEERLRDTAWQLGSYRRYADLKFYKGVEQVDLVESLAQRRCAEVFAAGPVRPEQIFVNVQPLSGAMANLAVFQALMKPNDTLMGMDLYQGGHLTHGSRFNLSGQLYRTVSYSVDPGTGRLDYDALRRTAIRHRPKVIVAGFTSYPWAADWRTLRAIADEAGAYLLADIAHTAGLVAGGVYPNPIGVAHVTTLTTNKTFCGPRGAVIMTTDEAMARAFDRAIFPGEQSAPHPNKIAAMAVAFQIAKSGAFKQLQKQILLNAQALARGLEQRGLALAYGGTDTHLMVVDLKAVESRTGFLLYGEPAARILDLAGLVVNKNNLPGDTETGLATGIRLGTPWVTQRGLVEKDMDVLANVIHKLLVNIRPFTYQGATHVLPRGKIELEILEEAAAAVKSLSARAGRDREKRPDRQTEAEDTPGRNAGAVPALRVSGWRARQFMQQVATADLAALKPGQATAAFLLDQDGRLLDPIRVLREEPAPAGQDRFLIAPSADKSRRVAAWLQGLADGYTLFDRNDIFRKVEGPVTVEPVRIDPAAALREQIKMHELPAPVHDPGPGLADLYARYSGMIDLAKPYFIGQAGTVPFAAPTAEPWHWKQTRAEVRVTPLSAVHQSLGAKMIEFEGWHMPVWYDSAIQEHERVRTTAGLFDITHMGVFEIAGPDAVTLLDAVFSNYAAWLEEGRSCYGYLPDPQGEVIDDAIIYCLRRDRYLMVVNAANEAKDWEWLNLVHAGKVVIDAARPWVRINSRAVLRNLKADSAKEQRLCLLALQGPASPAVLQALLEPEEMKTRLGRLQRGHLCEGRLEQTPLIVSRTGYTGEECGYELFVHPDHAVGLWRRILEAGQAFGIGPAGLAARDSVRTEAGLPLWGRELAGEHRISPLEAGFGAFVKFHKPFFIGREALLTREQKRPRRLIRFRIGQRNVRRPKTGDPVLDPEDKTVGMVTSCAVGSGRLYYGMALVEQAGHTGLRVYPSNGKPRQLKDPKEQPALLDVLPRFREAGAGEPESTIPSRSGGRPMAEQK